MVLINEEVLNNIRKWYLNSVAENDEFTCNRMNMVEDHSIITKLFSMMNIDDEYRHGHDVKTLIKLNVSKFKGHLCLCVRVEHIFYRNNKEVYQKNYNIYKNKIKESYEVNRHTTAGWMSWYPMRDINADYKFTKECKNIHSMLFSEIKEYIDKKDDDDELMFIME